MLCIVNAAAPSAVLGALGMYADIIPFETNGITYPEISNHPDVFFCKVDNYLVYAPNTPEKYIQRLRKSGIQLIKGEKPVGNLYPASAYYNGVATGAVFIHHREITDTVLAKTCHEKEFIHVNQGYTRCSVLPITDNAFITSDEGIHKQLEAAGKESLLVNSSDIELPGMKSGFFGGCTGIFDNAIYIMGSLSQYSCGETVRQFLAGKGRHVINLANSPLFDGGSLLFLPTKLWKKMCM
ncbi:MAG: hypothetical protein LWX56_06065 [Ignavibacteria bacterium]|nr:hypothetical protein [Ignavibacteria bacterium]